MAQAANGVSGTFPATFHDALQQLGAGFTEFGAALGGLMMALVHMMISFAEGLLQTPGAAIAGIVFGAAVTL